jgi:pyrimidine and pyridine-specific 5'-nucleotidase
MWLFTNAYVTHGKRVVKLLGIDDLFEGMTFCDYGAAPFACKPHPEMFNKAMKEAGIEDNSKCYFVGELHLCLEPAAQRCSLSKQYGVLIYHR